VNPFRMPAERDEEPGPSWREALQDWLSKHIEGALFVAILVAVIACVAALILSSVRDFNAHQAADPCAEHVWGTVHVRGANGEDVEVKKNVCLRWKPGRGP
jgi:hypothetical protein